MSERPTSEELAARVREGIESDSGEYGLQDDALAALSELDEQRVAAVHALEAAERERDEWKQRCLDAEEEVEFEHSQRENAERERDEQAAITDDIAARLQSKLRDLAITRQALLDISRAYAPSPGWLRERIDAAFRSLNMSDELGGF